LLKESLATSKKIVILPHRNADGDALGSTLALNHFLKQKKIIKLK
jgi:phosphoesterase RecJ-like protein